MSIVTINYVGQAPEAEASLLEGQRDGRDRSRRPFVIQELTRSSGCRESGAEGGRDREELVWKWLKQRAATAMVSQQTVRLLGRQPWPCFAFMSDNKLLVRHKDRVYKLPANLCLDDYGWGTTNDTIADLWKCSVDNGVPPQHWILQQQESRE